MHRLQLTLGALLSFAVFTFVAIGFGVGAAAAQDTQSTRPAIMQCKMHDGGCPMHSASDTTSADLRRSGHIGGMGQMGMHHAGQGGGMQGGMQGGLHSGKQGAMQGEMKGGMRGGMCAGMMGGMHSGGGMGMSATVARDGLSAELSKSLTAALQDEYKSENTYLRVLADHGDVLPFKNIVYAEKRHAAHIADVFAAAGESVPTSAWTVTNVPQYESAKEACTASIVLERENVALYDRLLAGDLTDDVRTLFTHLRGISEDRHLPAFERCAKR